MIEVELFGWKEGNTNTLHRDTNLYKYPESEKHECPRNSITAFLIHVSYPFYPTTYAENDDIEWKIKRG